MTDTVTAIEGILLLCSVLSFLLGFAVGSTVIISGRIENHNQPPTPQGKGG